MKIILSFEKRKIFLLILITIIIGISGVSAIAPNPGHSWNQMECDSLLCINPTSPTWNAKVGIGTTNPSRKLHVVDNLGYGIRIQDLSAPSLYLDLKAGSDLNRAASISAADNLIIGSDANILIQPNRDTLPIKYLEIQSGINNEPEISSANNLHIRSSTGNLDLDIGSLSNPPFRITLDREIQFGQRFGEVTVRLRGSLVEENNKPVYFVSVDSDECGGVHSYLGCPVGFNKAGRWRVNGGSCDSGSLSGTGYENGNTIRGWMVLCVAN